MKKLFSLAVFLIFVGVGLGSAQAALFSGKDNQNIKETITSDAFLVGNFLKLDAPIEGELFAAGNTIAISEPVARSLFVAGNTITVEKGGGYNAFLAGNSLNLAGEFGHDVYLTGERIELNENTVVKGDLWVGGNEVIIKGRVEGNIHFRAQSLTLNATIDGNLNGEAEKVNFDGGRVAKDFTYKSASEATGLDKVTIDGKTERSEPTTSPEPNFSFLNFLYTVISLMVLGTALIWSAPVKIKAVRQAVNEKWTQNFFRGLLIVLVVPMFLLLLIFSMVGWKLMGLALAAYIALLIASSSIGLMLIGEQITRLFRSLKSNLWLELLFGVLAITIFRSLPGIGWLVSVAAFIGATVPVVGASLTWWREKAT